MICPNCGENPCGAYARCVVTDDELIEKMARAEMDYDKRPWDTAPRVDRIRHCDRLRAALTALREAGYEIARRDTESILQELVDEAQAMGLYDPPKPTAENPASTAPPSSPETNPA